MNPFSLGLVFSVVTTFGLAFWVLHVQRHSKVHRIFALYLFSIGFWASFSAVQTLSADPNVVSVAVRVMHWGAIFISVFYLHFLYHLTGKIPRWFLILCYAIAGIFLILNHTPLFVSGIQPKEPFHFFMIAGPIYPLYILFFLLTWSFAVVHLGLETRRAEDQKKRQLKLLFVGSLIGYVGGSGAFLPVYDLRFPLLYPYGNFAIAIYVSIMTYAIIRHHFLDIEVIIRKTLVFTGLFAMIMAIVTVVTTLTQDVISQYWAMPPMVSTTISVMLAILLYDPTRRLLVNLTDRFLFQKKFSLTTIIAQASEAIALVQSLKWLSRRIVAFLVTKCRIKHAVVYIRDRDGNFSQGAIRGYGRDKCPPESIPAGHALIRYLERTRRPLALYRLEEEFQEKNPLYPRQEVEQIRNAFTDLKAELVVPSFLRRRIEMEGLGKEKAVEEEEVALRNILILGGKKSDEPYSDEELEVFSSLAQESAIAVENARLYDEAIERTRELAKMNQELEETNKRLEVTQASLIVAEKNATMVDMAKAIGHEVNNPLTGLMLQLNRIRENYVPKGRQLLNKISDRTSNQKWTSLSDTEFETFFGELKEWVRELEGNLANIESTGSRVDSSALRIGAVIHTLTDILKESKGEMTPLSLLVVFKETLSAIRFLTYEENLAGCEIIQNVTSHILILGDLNQLLQVFVNLIKNAYEAMEGQKDRRIVISGEMDPENPKMARIEISDNGPGIPPEILPKIWLQGFSTKTKKDDSIGAVGQGQGLFVSKHVIESIHKGTIHAESEPGKGTKFVIKLPLAELGANV